MAEQAELDRVRAALEKRRVGKELTTGEIAAVRKYEHKRAEQHREMVYRAVPQGELAALTDTPPKTLIDWERDGFPVHRVGRTVTYDLHQALPWMKRRWMGGESGDTSKRAAEIKLLVRREAALQLKMQLMSGELVHRDEVERGNCERIKMVRAGLEALRRALAPAVLELGEDATLDDAESLIWDYVRPLLEAFSRDSRVRHPARRSERRRAEDMAASRPIGSEPVG